MSAPYDALLVVSFGGPEGPDDVMPFLRNVVRGRGVPDERLREVAHHYDHFAGVSPITAQNRALCTALRQAQSLPVYLGNRHWDPMLADTLRQMADDGIEHAVCFVTSGFGSSPGCARYRTAMEEARSALGSSAPRLTKLPLFWDEPGFLDAVADKARVQLDELPGARLIFTAHSIPSALAAASNYEAQLLSASQAVARRLESPLWDLVYQSRSGPPHQPWLEPDILDHLRALPPGPVVVIPIGFVSDHVEVLWDLDEEAAQLAAELGRPFRRAQTVGTHPTFVDMIGRQIDESVRARPPSSCGEHCCVRPSSPSDSP